MSDQRRLPSRASGPRGRRALVATAAAAAVVILGGIAVASAVSPDDPSVTDVTIDPETTETTATSAPDPSTTDTTAADPGVDDTTTTTVEADDEAAGGDEAEHPDNHGEVVSEAAKDHSQDEAYGNHGRYVSGVARGEIDPTTDTTAAPVDADSSKPGKGRGPR